LFLPVHSTRKTNKKSYIKITLALIVIIRKRTKKIATDSTHKFVRIFRVGNFLKFLLSNIKTILKMKQFDRLLIGRIVNESRKALDLLLPVLDINLLLMFKTSTIPFAGKHVLQSEHVTDLRISKSLTLIVAMNHDVDNCTKRWAKHRLSAILKVVLANDLLNFNETLNSFSEAIRILLLWVENIIFKHIRIVKHTTKEVSEFTSDTPAKTRSLDKFTLVFIILHTLKIALLLEVVRITLELLHTRHDLRSKETDIMTEGLLRTNLTSRSRPATKTSEDVRDEQVVKISREGKSVERTLGKSTFTASAGGGWAGTADAADKIHEQLRKILVVERIVAAQVGKTRLGHADTTTKHDKIHRDGKRLITSDAVEETHGNVRNISIFGVDGIRTNLKITWIGTAFAVDETSVGRANIKVLLGSRLVDALGSLNDKLSHGLGELLKARNILGDFVNLLDGHRLKVGNEVARLDKVGLTLSIKTTVDTIIRTLEKTELAVGGNGLGDRTSVLRNVKRGLAHVARRLSWVGLISRKPSVRNSDGSTDIILHLNLAARDVINTSLESTPHVTVRRHTDTKEASTDLTIVKLDLVAIAAVDEIHREVCTPVQTPLLGPETLDVVHNREDVRWEVSKPGVILVSVNVARSKQLDNATNGTLAGKKRTIIDTFGILVTSRIIVGKDFIDEGKVLLRIIDKERTVHKSTIDVLGQLTLATTGNSARLVEHSCTTISTDQTPCRSSRVVDGLETITVRKNVNLARNKTDGLMIRAKSNSILVKAER